MQTQIDTNYVKMNISSPKPTVNLANVTQKIKVAVLLRLLDYAIWQIN